MTKAKLIPHRSSFDLTGWSLETFDGTDILGQVLKEWLFKGLGELLGLAAAENIAVSLPASFSVGRDDSEKRNDGYGGPEVIDPLIVYVELPIAGGEGDGPVWSFDFRTVVREEIEWHEMGPGGPIEGGGREMLESLKDSLVGLVVEINGALARKEEVKE